MKLLIASNNKHKLSEFQEIFNLYSVDIQLITPAQAGIENLNVIENGETLEENSLIKAKAFFEASEIISVADDTGLEVKALGEKPGVHSARFAGENANDADNRLKLLNMLRAEKEKGNSDRSARFRTVICLYSGSQTLYFTGICPGSIIENELGGGGFGYDSIFIPDGFDKTFAEMAAEEKNKISHRGRALKEFINYLETVA